MRILVVAAGPRAGHNGYKHRALQMATELARQGHRVWALWYFPLYCIFERHDLKNHKSFKIIGIPALPSFYYPAVTPIARTLCQWITRLVLRVLRCDAVQFEGTPIFITGIPSTKIVIDYHGDPIEEHVLGGAPAWKLRLAHRSYQTALTKADGIIAVSERFRAKIVAASDGRRPASVVAPCGVNLDAFEINAGVRAEVRRELGIEQRIVLCYLGGLQFYQCVPETLDLVARLRSLDRRVALMLLTEGNLNAFRSQLAEIGDVGHDVICLSPAHDEVPRLLSAADIGLLMRAATEVNAVSSPTKFGEYLAAGVPVLTTEYAGDAPAIVNAEQCGLVLLQLSPSADEMSQILDLLERVNNSRQSWAQRCRSAAACHRSWEVSGRALQRLYSELYSPGTSSPEPRLTSGSVGTQGRTSLSGLLGRLALQSYRKVASCR